MACLIFKTPDTIVSVTDQPDPAAGGACHVYEIRSQGGDLLLGTVSFQHGNVLDHGINGVQHLELLAIIQHRLDCFQKGPFSSAINEITSGFVSAAMGSEETRTRRRVAAGTEGTTTI